jgi:hypothetical protein
MQGRRNPCTAPLFKRQTRTIGLDQARVKVQSFAHGREGDERVHLEVGLRRLISVHRMLGGIAVARDDLNLHIFALLVFYF